MKSKGLSIGQQDIPTEFYQRDIFSNKVCRPFIIKPVLHLHETKCNDKNKKTEEWSWGELMQMLSQLSRILSILSMISKHMLTCIDLLQSKQPNHHSIKVEEVRYQGKYGGNTWNIKIEEKQNVYSSERKKSWTFKTSSHSAKCQ